MAVAGTRAALTALLALGAFVVSAGPAGGAGGGTFTASLTGAQEVPATNSTATGSATVTLDQFEIVITVKITFSGLSVPVTAALIQDGAAGTNGPLVFNLSTLGFPASTSGTFTSAPIAIDAAHVTDLKAGLLYVSLHDSTFPGGEIRGQLSAPPPSSPPPPASASGTTTPAPVVVTPRFTG